MLMGLRMVMGEAVTVGVGVVVRRAVGVGMRMFVLGGRRRAAGFVRMRMVVQVVRRVGMRVGMPGAVRVRVFVIVRRG
jgi:hypothetical protein